MSHSLNRRIVMAIAGVAAVLGLLAWPAATQNDEHALKTEIHQGHRVVAGEVLVKLRGAPALDQIEQDTDADRHEKVGGAGIRLIHSRTHNVDTLVSILSRRADVEFAEPNWVVYAVQSSTPPNDSSFSQLWGLSNTGQTVGGVAGIPGADIGAAGAWQKSTGSRANVVGVVDTGIDYTHPDLAANVWSAPTQFIVTVGGRQITCAAGTHGFNAITNTCDPMDDNNHGTHVSGTIGAAGNNMLGVAGVNWVASIMGLKFLGSSGSGTTANAINAIEFAVQAKKVFGSAAYVRVLSNSWGGGGSSQALLDEINRANSDDMLFVAAAGNNGTSNDTTAFYPANYDAPNVIAVAATDNKDGLASFSNYGATTVDLGAPGVYILSTVRGNQYASYNGTSMATPHVSGAAALVLSSCTLNTAGLKATLLNNVVPISSLASRTVTGGRLNVANAVNNCGTTPPPPPPPPASEDFTIAAAPGAVNLRRGGTATYTVTVGSVAGFTSPVSLDVTGIPQAATATFSAPSVTPPASGSASSTLRVTTIPSTGRGTYTVTISGKGSPNGTLKTLTTRVSLKVR